MKPMRWMIFLGILGTLGCAGTETPKPSPQQDAAQVAPQAKAVKPPQKQAAPKAAPAPVARPGGLAASGNAEAQRRFERALVLTYGFNHAEAHKTFLEAAEADPACALCTWGAALVLGPNINLGMDDASVPAAYELSRRALSLSDPSRPVAHALITALAERYQAEPGNRAELDAAYAEALRGAARQFPDHPVVQVLLAEALMDLHPWDYWDSAGQPKPWTPEILATLATALRLDPDNPNANHLHIHAVEASPHPEQAEASADRLRALAPDSGHLLHMPAHIYMRIGRYADAAEVNARAIENDESYRTHAQPQGIYPLAYMPHNRHFLWIAAANTGQSERAIEAAFGMATVIDTDKMRDPTFAALQHFHVMPLFALVRFGKWDEILIQPEPELPYPRGVWRYARGRALTGLGRFNEAERELGLLDQLAADPALGNVMLWGINKVTDLLAIARHVLAGELAFRRGEVAVAVTHLEQAVAVEDSLRYDEPPSWYYPARQNLGAVLAAAGRHAEAEAVFRRDLERHRDNGWSLYGLWQSLKAQGKSGEAGKIRKRFEKTWEKADVTLSSARF